MLTRSFSKLSGNVIGILLMLSMVLAALIMSGFVKSLDEEIDFRLMLLGRFVFSLPILYLFGWYVRGKDLLKIEAKKTLFARVTIGLVGICLWFSALQTANFGQVTALTQSSAVFVALFAPIFLSEKIGVWRISAITAGLIGILLITNPFSGAMTLGVLIQTSSAFREVQSSFSLFLQNWTRITELRSIHKRLMEFEEAINFKNKLRKPRKSDVRA